MTARRTANLVAVLLPPLAVVAAAVLSWNEFVEPVDLVILVVGYGLTCVGITVGFHRLLTHRSFKTYPVVALHARGAGHARGRGIGDQVGNRPPQAPRLRGRGRRPTHPPRRRTGGARRGPRALARPPGLALHDGRPGRPPPLRRRPPEGSRHPSHRRRGEAIDPGEPAIPFLLGLAIKGSFTGALLTLVWGGLLRIFLLHHATFAINSICHFFGRRRFATDDQSTNVGWLSLLTFGESWHNNHHAFPTSAFHGLRRQEFDPGDLLIRGLEQLGLAWDFVRVSPDRQLNEAIGRTA